MKYKIYNFFYKRHTDKKLTLRDHFGQTEKIKLLGLYWFSDIHIDMIIGSFWLNWQTMSVCRGHLVNEHVSA